MESNKSKILIMFTNSLRNKIIYVFFLDEIILLEDSTHNSIPSHLIDHLNQNKNYSNLQVINAMVHYVACSCGFVSKKMDLNNIRQEYTWFYSFASRVLKTSLNFYTPGENLKFVMDPNCEIVLKSHEISSDLVLVVAYEVNSSTKVCRCESVLLPMSRFMPFKKIVYPIPTSFRYLKELSLILKESLFFPLRNEIFYKNEVVSSWLNGMPEQIMLKIYSYLNCKDKENLRRTCKIQHKFLSDMKKCCIK